MSVPTKKIFTQKDIDLWRVSPAYVQLTQFIQDVNTAVKGKLLSDPLDVSPVCRLNCSLMRSVWRLFATC